MVLTLPGLLAVFSFLALSSAVYFFSVHFKLPYTVMLVVAGTVILVPLSTLPFFSFLREFTLTPELLLYIFLPVLIFESAYNIDARRLFENIVSISALSIVSLILSAAVVAFGLYIFFPLIGLEIPFLICLLFGALISATDPVAVLALFKEVGAPRRLTLLFEGESIFNDGTAVALFLVVLGIAEAGWHGAGSIVEGIASFAFMVIGGISLGFVLGGFFAKAIDYARSNEFVQITLMIVSAHFTFLLSDFLSEALFFAGHHFHISAIISTAVASIILGNYGRAKVLPHAQEFVEKFWSASAFLVNSLVFILIGFIFAALPISLIPFIVPVLLSVIVVAVARAFSIYPVVWILNRLTQEEHVPLSWQHLLAWGSLRGALALTMVLLIPNDFTVNGWMLDSTPKEFMLALTVGCIFATLFLKATTIQWLAGKLKVGTFTEMEKMEYQEALALIHLRALERIERFSKKGYIDQKTADMLHTEHKKELEYSCALCSKQMQSSDRCIGERVFRLYAIGIEKETLDTLYDFGEVNEYVYRRVLRKLSFQYEKIEAGDSDVDPTIEGVDDILGKFSKILERIFSHKQSDIGDQYLYYRTQSILSRTVLHELKHLDGKYMPVLFGEKSLQKLIDIYGKFLEGSSEKMRIVVEKMPEKAEVLSERFARRAIFETESKALKELTRRSMITPKVSLALQEKIGKGMI